ncbi:MAG: beta-lactamase induction protein [Rhodanobacter sp.]
MAIHLLVALLALALLHLWPRLASRRGDELFRRWVRQLNDTSGAGRVLLALLPPVALCVLIVVLLGRGVSGALLEPLFALIVLVYCFGPRDFEADVEAILNAPDGVSREVAAQKLADDGERVAWSARALGSATVYAALRRRFAVLLWFFLLGPTGALAYRLAQTLARDAGLQRDNDTTAARYFANAADWVPAQLLTFTLALVGHWEAVIAAWRGWHSQAQTTSWYRSGPDFLGAAARANVQSDIEGGDGYSQEHSDPVVELVRLRSTLLRALLAWLSVVALIVIGGWMR